MKTTRSVIVATFTAVALFAQFAIPIDASAQFGGGGMGGMGGKRGARMGMGADKGSTPKRGNQESVANLVEYRLMLLQEDLRLTREQESGWLAYEERVKALAGDLTRERERAQSAALTSAVEQVDHATDSARNHLTAWEDIAAATKTFYASLTPQQKLLIDQRSPSIVHELSGVPVPGDPGPKSPSQQ